MKIVIAIDSYKGSLSSLRAGNAVKDAISRGCRRFIVGIGGVVTMDCGIFRDGKLYPEHLEMMSKLSEI